MTIKEFTNNHIRYNLENDKAEVYGLTILNAATGKECMQMCGLFGLSMSSAMALSGLDDEYVSFMADENAKPSYFIGSAYKPKLNDRTIYYPEIEPILDDIFTMLPSLAEQMPGAIKETFDSNELYSSLGMDKISK